MPGKWSDTSCCHKASSEEPWGLKIQHTYTNCICSKPEIKGHVQRSVITVIKTRITVWLLSVPIFSQMLSYCALIYSCFMVISHPIYFCCLCLNCHLQAFWDDWVCLCTNLKLRPTVFVFLIAHLSWLHPLGVVPSEKLPWEQEEHEDFLRVGCHIVASRSIKSGGCTAICQHRKTTWVTLNALALHWHLDILN